jgi:hypothetical protein
MVSNLIVRFRKENGELGEWVVQSERLTHILTILEHKGWVLLGTEELS